MDDAMWDRLISKIRDDKVIPVVGPQLLVDTDGHSSLQARIAQKLLDDAGSSGVEEPLPPFNELAVAASILSRKGKTNADLSDRVSYAIKEIAGPKAKNFVLPRPLEQLGLIVDFSLLVTLTADDLLARCLQKKREVHEIVYSTTKPCDDLPKDWQKEPGSAYLLYLFGKSTDRCAVHDEDYLEYAHNLIRDGEKKLALFLGELQTRDLLMIGCNFPDWMSRFMLRATARKRLSEDERKEWLIESCKQESALTCFINSYGRDITILSDIPPVEFVNELYKRWSAAVEQDEVERGLPEDEVVPRGAVFFVSYSRTTDLPSAQALYDALMGMGLSKTDVWFDRTAIEPGQNYQNRILEGIRKCRHFLPLVSEEANNRKEGFVFSEWNAANDRLESINAGNYEFLIPVIVDKEYTPDRYTAEPVQEWCQKKKLDFGYAPSGMPDEKLVAKLKSLVRDARRENPAP